MLCDSNSGTARTVIKLSQKVTPSPATALLPGHDTSAASTVQPTVSAEKRLSSVSCISTCKLREEVSKNDLFFVLIDCCKQRCSPLH